MKHSFKIGLSFGLTSSVITTIGLIVGLGSSTGSRLVIIGGILTIAVADSLSDALGIHISEESKNAHKLKGIWESTIVTFFSKLIFALTFLIPVLLFQINTAIYVSIIWGLSFLGILSYFIARDQKIRPWKTILEHLSIALVVIIVTYFIGIWIKKIYI